MTNEEAKKMLKAKLECLKNETSGINHDCNMRLCDGCSLNYEQGNIGEQEEALEIAIKALEQTARIAKLVNKLNLAEILPKDYDNIFYLQSVREVKEEMWRMYRFAKDVSDTLNL
jgi:hypothetical protein